MIRGWMIAECIGDSVYEAHTIPFVYMKKEWAEHQKRVLESDDLGHIYDYKIREVQLVESGPNDK